MDMFVYMEYSKNLIHVYIMYKDQILYLAFPFPLISYWHVLGIFRFFSSSYFEMHNKSLCTVVTPFVL
jgi:hypothetical protein